MADDVTLPPFLEDIDEQTILQEMLQQVPSDLDTSEGSFIWDAIAPAAMELAQAAAWAKLVLQYGFAQTTYGPYLDLRAAEHGITRRPAVQATGTVTFTGTPGTLIPSGTQVSTASTDAVPAIVFATTVDATITDSGTVDVPVQAVDGGSQGVVAAGSIVLLGQPITGVTSVTNAQATAGGLDEEDDATLLSRYLEKVQNQPTGGNQSDYVNWTLAVPNVGGASVVPCRDGPGTVSIAIIDTDKMPANQTLVDTVQDAIAPPWTHTHQANAMTLSGSGVSIDSTQTDAGVSVVKMVYDAGGTGQITDPNLQTLLDRPGIWTARVSMKVDNTAGTNDLVQIGVWSLSAGAWCKTSVAGSTDAVVTLKASDLGTSFSEKTVDFYWDGAQPIELRITRLQSDTTTTLWVEQVEYRSAFSKDTGEGKAPIGARVTVEAATAVPINVSAQLVIASGYDAATVQAAAQQAIVSYLQSIAFQSDNTVRYVRIANAILDVTGVVDCPNLTINGGTANISIGPQEVAVLGEVTWT